MEYIFSFEHLSSWKQKGSRYNVKPKMVMFLKLSCEAEHRPEIRAPISINQTSGRLLNTIYVIIWLSSWPVYIQKRANEHTYNWTQCTTCHSLQSFLRRFLLHFYHYFGHFKTFLLFFLHNSQNSLVHWPSYRPAKNVQFICPDTL
jgi:hypothetical protein